MNWPAEAGMIQWELDQIMKCFALPYREPADAGMALLDTEM